jgi:hypothetical protein
MTRSRKIENHKFNSGGRAGSQTRICSFGRYRVVQLHYPPIWNSRRESNPDLFVRTEASSCFRPREPHQIWRGCRELNSDLKVRSLAPSSVGPHPPDLEAAERFELSSSEVEARRIGPLCYAASSYLVRDAGIEPASSRLKGECISNLPIPQKSGG